MPIEICFYCNDWRNGNPTGKFEEVNVTGLDGDYIEIECAPTTLSLGGENMLRVGRKVVRYLSHRPWVGNWCWEGYTFNRQECDVVLEYLRKHRRAHCTGGPIGFFDKYNELSDSKSRSSARSGLQPKSLLLSGGEVKR